MTNSGSLSGKRIVVTRAATQAKSLAALIRQRGGIPLLYPCIHIAPVADPATLDNCLRRLEDFDWLAFTSSNAVRALQGRCAAGRIQPDLAQLRVAAVGAQTNAALRLWLGQEADFAPDEASAAALARTLPLAKGARLLLPQSDRANPATAEILRARGASIAAVSAYRTLAGSGGVDLEALLSRGEVDALTFASPSAITFCLRRCRHPKILDLPAACMGEATAAAATQAGFLQVVAPAAPGMSNMLDALAPKLAR